MRNLIKSKQSKEKDGPILGVRLAILYKRLVPPDLCVWNKGQHKLVARLIIQLRTILTRGSTNTITKIKTNQMTYLFIEPILLPLSPSIKAISTYYNTKFLLLLLLLLLTKTVIWHSTPYWPERPKSRGPKGLQLEVGPRRGP